MKAPKLALAIGAARPQIQKFQVHCALTPHKTLVEASTHLLGKLFSNFSAMLPTHIETYHRVHEPRENRL